VTTNTANVLKLGTKGRLEVGADADVLVWEKPDFILRDVVARGRVLMRNGHLTIKPQALRRSNRKIELHGEK
jgi:beta-aspartyl-dipeptidase (metallo-type)